MENAPIRFDFGNVVHLIKEARHNAYKAVNTLLIDLYWEIGRYITEKSLSEGWGKSTVKELAVFIAAEEPNATGFSDKNLWRMKQFYETYHTFPKLSPLVRELSWTHNLTIFSRSKSIMEMEFYLRLCIKEKYGKRELERQINSSVYERSVLGQLQIAAIPNVLPKGAESVFREKYVLEFLNLPEKHTENDLQKGLVLKMKYFIQELGKDFLFMGEEYRLQVGNKDFFIDLLFYHRELQCLVAFELKTTEFEPQHLGQLNFYLEALDRDVKKTHENPSIGILLCKDKDMEVVEYALSRNLSPTLVSQYETSLPNKKLLQEKLREIFESWDRGQEK